MSISKSNRIQKIATLAIILVLLIIANATRYTNNASKSFDNVVIKWYKDNWTGVDWITEYCYKIERYPAGLDPSKKLADWERRNYNIIVLISKSLMIAWNMLIFTDIAVLFYIINKKEDSNKSTGEPILDRYIKYFGDKWKFDFSHSLNPKDAIIKKCLFILTL